MPASEHNKVVSLSTFKKKAELSKPAQQDERVWHRVERLCHLSSIQTAANTAKPQRQKTWESAVSALEQYIGNEWPVEKINKVRADDVAEKAATLFVKGALSFPQSKKSTELQTMVTDVLEERGFLRLSKSIGTKPAL